MAPHITQLQDRVESFSDTSRNVSPSTSASSASSASADATTPPFTDLWPNLANLSACDSSPPSGAFFQDNYFPSDDCFLGDLAQISPINNFPTESPSSFKGSTSFDLTENPTLSPASASATYYSASSPTSSKIERGLGTLQNSQKGIPRSSYSSKNLPPSTAAKPCLEQLGQGNYTEDISFYDSAMVSDVTSANPFEVLKEPIDFNEPDSKRSRADGRADAISACWTSPLCPNYSEDGPTPNPATCGGGCAPFLFDTSPLPNPTSDTAIDVSSTDDTYTGVELRKTLKRSESESSNTPSRRTLSKPTTAKNKKASNQKDLIEESIETNSKSCGRQPHNQVERKYRESINTQLESLRRVIPSLQASQSCADDGDIEDLAVPSKPSKAIILASATAYIKQQEKDKRQLVEEVTLLQQQIKSLRALMKCDDCSLMQYVMDLNLRNGK